ncbi:restriction endonuclease subunit S [Mycoplasma sp. 48589B]
MNKNELKPSIRFKGFTDAWEKKKLSDISQIIVGKVVTKKETNGNGNYPIISGGIEPLGYLNKYNQVKDTVTVGRAGSAGNVQYQDTNFWLNDKCFALKSNSSTNDYFLYSMLLKYQNDIQNLVTIGTLPVLNSTKLKSLKLKFTATQEQKEIAEFFKALNELLTFYKRKSEKLENLKKSLLEKMFVSDGEQFPAIRFKGFTNAWEKQKISTVLKERIELSPKSTDFPLKAFVKFDGIVDKGERWDREFLVNDIENKLYKRTYYGDFIYSSNNLESGSIGMNKYGNAFISPVYLIFKPLNNNHNCFLSTLLSKQNVINKMIRNRQGVVYGQWRISPESFLSIEINIPVPKEQKEIGNFINSLDTLLAFYKRKCDKLENIKKSLLEKMFC